MTPDELRMQERQNEKDAATSAISVALNRLMDERREPDHWERVCLMRALQEVFSGCYGLAITDAHLALTSPHERSPAAKLPTDAIIERCDVALLSQALREAMAESVRQFPHLGPIEFRSGPAA